MVTRSLGSEHQERLRVLGTSSTARSDEESFVSPASPSNLTILDDLQHVTGATPSKAIHVVPSQQKHKRHSKPTRFGAGFGSLLPNDSMNDDDRTAGFILSDITANRTNDLNPHPTPPSRTSRRDPSEIKNQKILLDLVSVEMQEGSKKRWKVDGEHEGIADENCRCWPFKTRY